MQPLPVVMLLDELLDVCPQMIQVIVPVGVDCSLHCLASSIAKETKRRFDDDAALAFSLQGRKRLAANFLDIKRPFS
jgi:hypothetical protein